MADFELTFGAKPDGSFDDVGREAGRAVAAGVKAGSKAARQEALDLAKTLTALQRRTSGQLANAGKLGLDVRQFEPLERGLEGVLRLISRLQRESADGIIDAQGLRRIRTELDAVGKLISSQSREFQSTVAARNVTLRGELNAEKQAGQQRNIITRRNAELQVNAEKNAAKQRIVNRQILNSQLLQLERTLSQAVIGITRGAANAVQAVYNSTIGSVRRTFSTRRSIIEGGLRSETRLFQTQARQIQAIQTQSRSGVIGSLRAGGIAGGIGGGIGVAALGQLGFTRASDLEAIQSRLEVITNDVFKARALFLQVAEFAATTQFDLTGVADLASRLLVVGRNTEQVLPDIKALAGAVGLVGGGTAELEGVARALAQIKSTGRLMGDEINQIAERLPGLDVFALFAKGTGFGEDKAAFLKAKEAGEITGDAAVAGFLQALQEDPRFAAGLAKTANSFANLAANAREQFADVGAAFFDRFEKPIKAGLKTTIAAFGGLASFIRGGELSGGLELLRVSLGRVAIALAGIVAAKGAVEVFQLLGKGIGLLVSPIGLLGIALAAAGSAFVFFFQRSERFRDIVKGIADGLVNFGRNVGTFLLDRLRDLGQQLQPLLRVLRVVGDRIVDIARVARAAFTGGGVAALFESLRDSIVDLARDLFALSKPLRERIGDLLGKASDIALAFRDRLVAAFRSIDFGSIVGFLKTDLGQAVAGGAAGALVGGLLGGPVGAALGVAAAALIGKFVVPAIKRALSGMNVADLFGAFLNGVREVGQRIGEILSDRRTLLGVAGIAAAAAAIAVQFVSGFVSGILSNLGDIASAGQTILETLFSQASILKSVIALGILLRGALTKQFQSAGIGKAVGALIGRDIADETAKSVQRASLGTRLKNVFNAIGKAGGQAIGIGMASALAGSALGDAESGLEQGLGLAGILGSAAASFAIVGGGPQGAALAAATTGVGLLTAHLSGNAKEAREAKARMAEYLTVLREVGPGAEGAAEAIGDIFGSNLKDASDDAVQGLLDMRINAEAFERAIAEGRGEEALAKVKDQYEALNDEITSVTGDQGSIVSPDEAKRLKTATAALRFLEDQVDAVGDAKRRASLERLTVFDDTDTGSGAGRVRSAMADARREAERLTESERRAREEAKRLLEFRQSTELETALDGIRNKARDIGTAADESKRKLAELIAGPKAPDVKADTQETTRALPSLVTDITEAVAQGADSALGQANLSASLNEFKTLVSTQFASALTDADPAGALATSLQESTIAINQIATTPEARQALLDELNREFSVAQAKIPVGVKIAREEAQAEAIAGRAAMLEAAVAAGEIPVGVAANIAQAIESGGQIVATADAIVRRSPAEVQAIANAASASTAGYDIFSGANSAAKASNITIDNISADTGKAEGVGSDIAAGVKRGIQGGLSGIANAAAGMVNAALTAARAAAQTGSPSKVFMKVGKDVVDGFTIGIQENTADAVQAAEAMAQAVIEIGRTVATRMRAARGAARQTIFEEIFLGSAQQAREAGLTAQQNITTSFEGIRLAVESEAKKLWDAASTPAAERSAEQNRIIAANNFASLSNITNQKAIQEAVNSVRELGAAILAQGGDATAAANAMRAYRDSLIRTASAAGLNAAQVANLVNLLGLSNTALADFVRLSNEAVNVVNAAPTATPTGPNLTPGPNPVQMFIENRFDLPYGDPEAVSLAVVNRLAQKVR